MTTDNRTNEPTDELLREMVANLIPLDLIHDRARPGQPQDAFEAADRIIDALRAHGLLSEGAPSEEQIAEQSKALAVEIHEAWEFQYDQCDHGTYRGGHMNGEPYAMCEITAERIVRRRAAAGVVPQEPSKEIHEPDTNRIYCVRCGYDWPCQPAPSPAREELAQREAEEYAPDCGGAWAERRRKRK